MSVLTFSIISFLGSFLAGLLGALTGLGGAVIIIPLLTLGLGVDFHYAIGAGLVSVIATSSGAAAAYVKEGITNMRIGMFLEIATTLGAVVAGAFLTNYLDPNILRIIFGLILLFSAFMSLKKKINHEDHGTPQKWSKTFKLNGSYPTHEGISFYTVRNVIGGWFMMLIAGIMSGLLGIGSGALKVLAMDNIMRVPFKVSTTTSNFMIGVTAAASAVIYFQKGYINPGIAAPVMLGVLIGAMFGAKILVKAQTKWLRYGFAIVVTYLAIQMIYNGMMHPKA
ncbi:sulfite exporter TauE/SafE family protein [Taibaiella lutea]|uniref:Probable membrane transporter protein n=1 Tax=Taibaiella lutea TaxID=2608001 RepID=A0A5M6CSA5_9BACT|nr:sulfite exporter TauE/SafE family protein [Taibaiella lutea]KAA5537270.1 sulfite exporter TauE/SafE family protein [Taibaiella lutea]